jgi:hypothetical protein
MEEHRCRIAAVGAEDSRCEILVHGAVVELEDKRCRSLKLRAVLEVEDCRSNGVTVRTEDPRCIGLRDRW